MPYTSNMDLPERVRNNLPEHALDIYRNVFNNAWKEYDKPEDRRGGADREEVAHKVAWSAVKKEFQKDNSGKWIKKQ